jgi:hypothetical protein
MKYALMKSSFIIRQPSIEDSRPQRADVHYAIQQRLNAAMGGRRVKEESSQFRREVRRFSWA